MALIEALNNQNTLTIMKEKKDLLDYKGSKWTTEDPYKATLAWLWCFQKYNF